MVSISIGGSAAGRAVPVGHPGEADPVVGAGQLAVDQLGLGDGGAEVDVPQGGRLVLVGVARRPAGAGSSAGRPGGPVRRWWRRSGPSRPRGRGSARAPRRPARPRRSAARRGPRSWAADTAHRLLGRAPAGAARRPGRRGARGRSGPRSSSAPGARWAARCRPTPSGRRPPCPASAGSGPPCRCGCRRRRGRCGASPTPWAAGCRSRRPGPGWPSGRSGRSPAAAHAADHLASRPSRPSGRSRRPPAGLRRGVAGRCAGRAGMIGLPYPGAAAPRHRDRHRAPARPARPGRVSMYVCGPTVYDLPHLGHGRYALAFDVLRRYLVFSGLEVHYVSNVTDVDDHIIERAEAEGRDRAGGGRRVRGAVVGGDGRPGRAPPHRGPHATAYVGRHGGTGGGPRRPGRRLRDRRTASTSRSERWTATACWPTSRSTRSGRAPAVEASAEKRSPLDFALWKKAKPGEPTWPSPWGPGRPGWHTECVVMSLDLLGDGFDLHGGAIDLIFPHHENERAQAVAEGRAFARHWVHNGWVMVGGREDVEVARELHLAHRPAGSQRRPRLPPARSCAPTTDRRSRSPPRRWPTPRRRLDRLDASGPAVLPAGPAGRGARRRGGGRTTAGGGRRWTQSPRRLHGGDGRRPRHARAPSPASSRP